MKTADDLSAMARLTDPDFYAQDPHPVFALLRAESPVYWCDEGQFWALSKYEDVRKVGSNPRLFSSERGTLISDGLARDSGGPHMKGARHLIRSDPPLHSDMRRMVSRSFTPRSVDSLEPKVRLIVDDVLGQIDGGSVTNVVEAISAPLTTFVIAELMGVPRERWTEFWKWTDSAMRQVDTGREDLETAAGVAELLAFFGELCDERRRRPGEDIISELVGGTIDGEPLSELDLLTFCKLLLVAGTETTRNLVTAGVQLLAEHPDQRRSLIDRTELLPGAVEEMLRYSTPVLAFARTAKEDTEIRGQAIAEGDFVVMLYPSANRDEDIWTDPDRFDTARPQLAPNVAFGFGPHVCLGAPLARMEARVLFEGLLRAFPDYELAGPPVRHGSTLVAMITHLPVVLGRRAA
jgi:cytochrome P450